MSGEQPNLAVSQAALQLIKAGIDKAHGELKEHGRIGEATAGHGFADLSLSAMDMGHPGLAQQFETFCERWGWGVRTLVQKGTNFAAAVGVAAGGFQEQDQYVKNTVKVAVNSVNGNPHLSEEGVAAKDWDEIKSQRPTDNPDYSAESMARAQAETDQLWRDTRYDVLDAQMDSMERSGLISAQERQQVEAGSREVLDPSREAVERAGQ
ncbi:hypothetical protein [Streptomyces sp. NPDC003036]|uniref:hypothetical protein n=1 Tax=Streptomyces sp. NPDC003036 TaxID=3154442 RepID=UPI0033AF5DD8